MRIRLLLIIFILFFFRTSPVNAQSPGGIFFCQWNGPEQRCELRSSDCLTNYQPGNCAELYTDPTPCQDNLGSTGNDCIPDIPDTTPTPGSVCSIGRCSVREDCFGNVQCRNAQSGNACSGVCSCAQGKCNTADDCQGVLDLCSNPIAGQWCSGSCNFSEESEPTGTALYCDPSGNQTAISSNRLYTAFGCIPIGNMNLVIAFIYSAGIRIAGGVAFIIIVLASIQILTSKGDPEKLSSGRQMLNSAIIGLLLLVFSIVLLRVIGQDVLGILFG